jgi:hypothetical protein
MVEALRAGFPMVAFAASFSAGALWFFRPKRREHVILVMTIPISTVIGFIVASVML